MDPIPATQAIMVWGRRTSLPVVIEFPAEGDEEKHLATNDEQYEGDKSLTA